MNRRNFIKLSSVASVAALAVPSIIVKGASNERAVTLFNHIDGRKLNFPVKEGTMTVLQLHRKLQDMADDMLLSGGDELDITDHNPSVRYIDSHIELLGGWDVEENSLLYLSDGSLTIKHTGAIYTGMCLIGFSKEDINETEIVIYDENSSATYTENDFITDIKGKSAFAKRGDQCYDIRDIIGENVCTGRMYVPAITKFDI